MPDTSGHDQPQTDECHTVPLRELEVRLAAEGVLMSRRQLTRHCEGGTFDARKLPAVNNVLEWFVAPASIDKGIADIKTLQEMRARRDASRPDVTHRIALDFDPKPQIDTTGHVETRPAVSAAATSQRVPTPSPGPRPSRPDTTGHNEIAPSRETSTDAAGHDATRHATTDDDTTLSTVADLTAALDIFTHPYVLRLEDRVERLEAKYEAQVRRTEEIQIKSQERLVELQRMTAVGQSQTLADFMLKAKDWMLGGPADEKGREDRSN